MGITVKMYQEYYFRATGKSVHYHTVLRWIEQGNAGEPGLKAKKDKGGFSWIIEPEPDDPVYEEWKKGREGRG